MFLYLLKVKDFDYSHESMPWGNQISLVVSAESEFDAVAVAHENDCCSVKNEYLVKRIGVSEIERCVVIEDVHST